MKTLHAVLVLALAVVGYLVYDYVSQLDVLQSFDEDMTLGHTMIQAALIGFCLNTAALDKLLEKEDAEAFDMHQADMEKTNFKDDGNINEDDYTKQSIYSILYSVYADLNQLRHRGELYQFRFNTWGVTGVWNESLGEFEAKNGYREQSVGAYPNNLVAYPKTTPQKAGKTAYASLVNFKSVKEYLKERRAANPGALINVVEIGSGTGAGANELTWLHEDFNYTAIDMQRPGTAMCKKFHQANRLVAPMPKAGEKPKPEGVFEEIIGFDHRLTCVQGNGQYLHQEQVNTDGSVTPAIPSEFADIVLISETHIADVIPLDEETKRVFQQVLRILKPGGFFVWGNAIPTSIWRGSFDYMQNELGMIRSEIHDVTDNALQARDDDYSRALDFFRQGKETYYGLKWFPACSWSLNRLIMNFYRQPGTALYKRMMRNSNATKENPDDREWCKELAVPTSFCDDRRVDTYAHVAYQKAM